MRGSVMEQQLILIPIDEKRSIITYKVLELFSQYNIQTIELNRTLDYCFDRAFSTVIEALAHNTVNACEQTDTNCIIYTEIGHELELFAKEALTLNKVELNFKAEIRAFTHGKRTMISSVKY